MARGGIWMTVATACVWLAAAGAACASPGELVVVAHTGVREYGEVADTSSAPAISADGRFVAYVPPSDAGDPLMLRDLRRGTTATVVSPSEAPGADYGWSVSWVSISAGGRYIAFASPDPALSREDDRGRGGYGVADVFVHDRLRRTQTMVSRRSGAHGRPGNMHSTVAAISGDGRRVVYDSSASNLVSTRPPTFGGVFARDLRTERNSVVSAVPGIDFFTPQSFDPAISGDGRRVAYGFQYSPPPYDPERPPRDPDAKWLSRRHKQIMLEDSAWRGPKVASRADGRRGRVANEHCREPSVSESGRFVAFTSDATNLARGDRNGVEDVFVRDVRKGRTTLVSRVGRGGRVGDQASSQPSISGDGRFVAFTTKAGNLVPGDPDDVSDVLVKDLRTGTLALASHGLGGAPAEGRSAVPAISADGRYVAFYSTASNIVPDKTTRHLSVYRFQVRP